MLGEVLERIALAGGDIINTCNVTRSTEADGLRVAPTVVRLPRMAACGRLVPAEHMIVVFGMAVANFLVVPGAPDVPLDPQVLLPKLVDEAREGPKQVVFHRRPQRTQALGVVLVLLEDRCQTRIPLAQRLLLRVRNVAQVGFGHPRHAVRGCQRSQQHPGVVGDHAIQSVGEISSQVGMAGKQRRDRYARTLAVNGPVLPCQHILTAAAVAEKVPQIVLHGPSR